ncbi:MAG: SPOR domain-containing protein [Clostridia bacterium]
MEYRRRHRKTRRLHSLRGGTYTVYTAVFLVFFGVVYVLAASKAGDWLAGSVIAPVMLKLAPTVSIAPRPTVTPAVENTSENTVDIQMIPTTCFALQMGVYASKENAEKQAKALQEIGAAGYLVQDAERFRVLAAGYTDEESAKKVSAQLLSEGVESRIYPITCAGRTLHVTASKTQVTALQTTAVGMTELLDELYHAAISFDREAQNVEDGASGLRGLRDVAADREDMLATMANDDASEVIGMAAFYATVRRGIEDVMEIKEKKQFTAKLKYLYLSGFEAYRSYMEGES